MDEDEEPGRWLALPEWEVGGCEEGEFLPCQCSDFFIMDDVLSDESVEYLFRYSLPNGWPMPDVFCEYHLFRRDLSEGR